MTILDGRKIAKDILAQLKGEIESDSQKPGLGVVLVGQDEASHIYVSLKEKAAREVGIEFRRIELPEDVGEEVLLKEVEKLNHDTSIHGMIVQLPLPKHLDRDKIIETIDPYKDVDGFHEENAQLFFEDKERFYPVFPGAILALIKETETNLSNKKAFIVANSHDFGKMMQHALEREGALVCYVLREELSDSKGKMKKADIVITACGVADLISGEDVKEKAIIIDGGIVKNGNMVVGDVNLKSLENQDVFVSPVPGGVGPVTIACLLKNVYQAYKNPL